MLGGLVILMGVPALAHADGGTVRASVATGVWQITVFTAPTPPRVGMVDVSVLVQGVDSGTLVPDVRVRIVATAHTDSAHVIECFATQESATNKLFQSAELEFPEAGRWEVRVIIERGNDQREARFDLEIGSPIPNWLALLPWVGWPAGAVLLYTVHRALVRRKQNRRQLPE